MEKKITIQLTESELDSIIYCLDLRANNSDAAEEWKQQYRILADKLQIKLAEN